MPLLFLIAGIGSWHSLRRRGPRRVRPGTAAAPRRAAGVRDADDRAGAAVAAAEGGRSRLRRVVPAVPAALLRRPPGSRPTSRSWSRASTSRPGTCGSSCCCWRSRCCCAPVAAGLPRDRLRRLRDRLGRRGAAARDALLPAVPVAVVSAVLGMEEPFAGWSRWAYLLFFLYGFVLAADDRFRAAMRRDAVPAAVLGVGAVPRRGLPALVLAAGDPFTDMAAPAVRRPGAVRRGRLVLAGRDPRPARPPPRHRAGGHRVAAAVAPAGARAT